MVSADFKKRAWGCRWLFRVTSPPLHLSFLLPFNKKQSNPTSFLPVGCSLCYAWPDIQTNIWKCLHRVTQELMLSMLGWSTGMYQRQVHPPRPWSMEGQLFNAFPFCLSVFACFLNIFGISSHGTCSTRTVVKALSLVA